MNTLMIFLKGVLNYRIFSTLTRPNNNIICSNDSLSNLFKIIHPRVNNFGIISGNLKYLSQLAQQIISGRFLSFLIFFLLNMIFSIIFILLLIIFFVFVIDFFLFLFDIGLNLNYVKFILLIDFFVACCYLLFFIKESVIYKDFLRQRLAHIIKIYIYLIQV